MSFPMKAKQKVLQKEIIFVYCENYVEHTNTLYRRALIDSDVKTRSTYTEK
jgi:hypothetical protein